MIKYYYGDMGSGKTLSMIIDAEIIRRKIESLNKKFLCFTDIDYKYKTNELWEILDRKYENKKDYKLLLFDEMDKFTDSRRAMTDINRFISYIISLSRKTNMYSPENTTDMPFIALTSFFLPEHYNNNSYTIS